MIVGVGLVLYSECLFCDFISVFMGVGVLFVFAIAQVFLKYCVFVCV